MFANITYLICYAIITKTGVTPKNDKKPKAQGHNALLA